MKPYSNLLLYQASEFAESEGCYLYRGPLLSSSWTGEQHFHSLCLLAETQVASFGQLNPVAFAYSLGLSHPSSQGEGSELDWFELIAAHLREP